MRFIIINLNFSNLFLYLKYFSCVAVGGKCRTELNCPFCFLDFASSHLISDVYEYQLFLIVISILVAVLFTDAGADRYNAGRHGINWDESQHKKKCIIQTQI